MGATVSRSSTARDEVPGDRGLSWDRPVGGQERAQLHVAKELGCLGRAVIWVAGLVQFEEWLDRENAIGARIEADKVFTFSTDG